MFEWLEVANEVVVLITGLLGLIGTGTGVYFAIKNWQTAMKTKTKAEQWAIIMEMADAAMTEVEKSKLSGESKKEQVLSTLATTATAAGINITDFIEQLNLYIDQTITFVNKMKNKD